MARFMRLGDAAQFDLDLANGPSLYLISGYVYTFGASGFGL